MQHLYIARWHSVLRSYRTNLSGVRLYDERRNFPVGTDDIFRENIGNFIPTSKINSSPCFGRRNGFHFFSTRENWFPISFNCKSIHCLFFLTVPIFENWRTRPNRERKYREFLHEHLFPKIRAFCFFSRIFLLIKSKHKIFYHETLRKIYFLKYFTAFTRWQLFYMTNSVTLLKQNVCRKVTVVEVFPKNIFLARILSLVHRYLHWLETLVTARENRTIKKETNNSFFMTEDESSRTGATLP